MMRSWSTCAALAGTVLGYHLVFGRAHVAEIAAQRAAMDASYSRFDAAEAAVAQETLLLDCATRLDRWRGDLTPWLTEDPSQPPFLIAATTSLEAAGLAVERSEALPSESGAGHRTQRVHVVVIGTLGTLFTAMCSLENSASPTRVTDAALRFQPGDRVQADLTIARTWSGGR